jgi:hypothetical protein
MEATRGVEVDGSAVVGSIGEPSSFACDLA